MYRNTSLLHFPPSLEKLWLSFGYEIGSKKVTDELKIDQKHYYKQETKIRK
jgi:hypothetical protein